MSDWISAVRFAQYFKDVGLGVAKWTRMFLDTLEDVDGDLGGGPQVGTAGERKPELHASEVAVPEPASKKRPAWKAHQRHRAKRTWH